MNKYLLKFTKQGNMRFISHLDIQRLFRRAIKRANLSIAYSSGFNPHEKMNIIQPLSLGFESDCEYFELTTMLPYETEELLFVLNKSMPDGISFVSCKEFVDVNTNATNLTSYAKYEALYPIDESLADKIDVEKYLALDQIYVLKRDKKTKKYVEKEIKSYIFSIEKKFDNSHLVLELIVKCATNKTLNPQNLIAALFKYFDVDFVPEQLRINRKDIYTENDGELISMDDINKYK